MTILVERDGDDISLTSLPDGDRVEVPRKEVIDALMGMICLLTTDEIDGLGRWFVYATRRIESGARRETAGQRPEGLMIKIPPHLRLTEDPLEGAETSARKLARTNTGQMVTHASIVAGAYLELHRRLDGLVTLWRGRAIRASAEGELEESGCCEAMADELDRARGLLPLVGKARTGEP